VPAGDFYDRWSSAARALESRSGRLFSVHGQLVAWRASSGILPRPGLAADDLNLMFQVRASGRGVRRVADALFLEPKTPRGAAARSQGLRRARAYFQALQGRRAPLGEGLLDRAQWAFYAHVPRRAPELVLLGALAIVSLATWWGGGIAAAGALAALAGAAALPAPRRALELLGWIRRARREAALGSGRAARDRWEMART